MIRPPLHGASPVVGIVGAGQLARMTYQAAIALDLRVRLLAEGADEAAAAIGAEVVLGSPRDAADLARFAASCDVITFDHELVDVAALRTIEQAGHLVRPGSGTIAIAQDKARQRALLGEAGLPVPAFRQVADLADLIGFGREQGWPIVAKAVRGGYDGRAVWPLADEGAAADLWARLDGEERPALLAEAHVPLDRELAVLVARRPSGEIVTYAVVETVQRQGICRELLVPAALPAAVEAEARSLGRRAAAAVGVVGILALELFLVGERLVVNEIAARPHNSGHWTIEGAVTSQFEQHLRAVLDWPLGATDLVAPAVVTANLLGGAVGTEPRRLLPGALIDPRVRVHLYGKVARPGRKLGHVTVLADTMESARQSALTAVARLGGAAG